MNIVDIKKKSLLQEKRTAKEFGGRTRGKASGASPFAKGDVKTPEYLVENKFTDKDHFILKWSVWEKIAKEALKEGFRTPLIQLDIQDESFIIFHPNHFEIPEEFICRIYFKGKQTTIYKYGCDFAGESDRVLYLMEKAAFKEFLDSKNSGEYNQGGE